MASNQGMTLKIRDNLIDVSLPLTSSGKFRCKTRNDIQDFGKGFAPKSEIIPINSYLEWQIGYDTEINNEKKPTSMNNDNFLFIGYNKKKKYPYELAEIIFNMCKYNIISKQELVEIYTKIDDINWFLKDNFSIEVKKEADITLNHVEFLSSSTKLPTFITRSCHSSLLIEIMIQKQQYATDVQPMLYLDIPVDAFSNRDNIINHTSTETPLGHLIFDSSQKFLIFNILLCFGMCSAAHNHDIKEIIKVIMKNAF